MIRLEYDEQKSLKNEKERGLSFSLVEQFDFETAFIEVDERFNYAETRFRAIGFILERLFVLVFCIRTSHLRVISLRKANAREVKKYEKYQAIRLH